MEPRAKLRRTKIVCTIGPRTDSEETIERLIAAGMDVARLNFSFGDPASHRRTIRSLRAAAGRAGKEIGILQDLAGPKIRLGNLREGRRRLLHGKRVALVAGETSQDDSIPVAYPNLFEDIDVGNLILLADGTVQLAAVDKGEGKILCEVLVGGVVLSHKGVNFPRSRLSVTAFTEKDRADLELGLAEGVDFVALSFIRTVQDLDPARRIVERLEHPPLLIAKVEKPQAVENFEQILSAVDGVMVARGDLGVEMPLEEVPMIQKRIIRMARKAGKPVITATQMLTSMLENPRPTRAEATDVANAILDGTDALMLSDETAMGKYPLEAVATLDRIARATEAYLDERRFLSEEVSELLQTVPAAISRVACLLALDVHAPVIVATTSSGNTARLVARFRPSVPIMALTDRAKTQRQLMLSWGVVPYLPGAFEDTDQMFASARAWALEKAMAGPGDRLVITAGVPVGVSGTTNLLKVMEMEK